MIRCRGRSSRESAGFWEQPARNLKIELRTSMTKTRMGKKLAWVGAALSLSLAMNVASGVAQAQGGKSVTVKGYVIDSACTFKNHLKKPISPECAEKCARAGSPLVIQTEDGSIYLPISGEMPAAGQNDRLMKYAGQMVTVTGSTYMQGGSRAIVIEKIEVVKGS